MARTVYDNLLQIKLGTLMDELVEELQDQGG
jgi:hypothetical protein